MAVRLALAGNQNSGKTTLFNLLTGSSAKVGNFPGVTVEKREGKIKGRAEVTLVDLPGVYSLLPFTAEERVARDYILSGEVDGIINLVDVNSLERGLYLTFELMERKIPMVVALNMTEELRADGGKVESGKLSQSLGIPVLEISAISGEGVDTLIDTILNQVSEKKLPQQKQFGDAALNRLIGTAGEALGLPFGAAELLEAAAVDAKSKLPPRLVSLFEEYEKSAGKSAADSVIDERYRHIEAACAAAYRPGVGKGLKKTSAAIDKIAANKYLGIPLFVLIMAGVFWLSFSVVGQALQSLCQMGIDAVMQQLEGYLISINASAELQQFVTNGVFAGVSSVMSFLPTIVILFLLLSILEDSGYMARVAYIMDRPFRAIGLSGRYIVPMLLGLGCSVPALMAARTVGSDSDRRSALRLVPFISCSAKLPVYMVFAGAFFKEKAFLAVLYLYFLGIAAAVVYALILKKVNKGNPEAPFVLELPDYRFPSVKNVIADISLKVKEFTRKAFSVILISSMVIWVLSRYTPGFGLAGEGDSLLAAIGRFVSPVFSPLGFGDWRMATSIISGIFAKEAVLSTLCVLAGCELSQIPVELPGLLSAAGAVSFLTFFALYMPCMAATAVLRKEMGGIKQTAVTLLAQTAAAYLVSFVIYRLALLLF